MGMVGDKVSGKWCGRMRWREIGVFNVGYQIGSENPDIRKFRIGEIAIRSEIFGSDHRVFRSDSGFSDRITDFSDRVRWIFWRILICLRSENPDFSNTRSEISEILKSDRISEISDRIGGFSGRVFLHTPSEREVMKMLLNVDALMGHYKRWYILMV